ncbi:MAG: hypothetical protein SGJ19_09960 [Planctomycetia bacterium]|nr:hypothetical protein [Planctomycetia bacterium]
MNNTIGRHRSAWSVVTAMIALLPCGGAVADEIDAAYVQRFAEARLLLCFQGKGSCLPYDAGVLHEAHARVPAIGKGQVVVAGNSSGSIPAAYFCCFGFSDAAVRHAEDRMLNGNRDAVRDMENPHSKLSKLSQGKRTEIPHDVLREYIGFALGVANWREAGSIDAIVRQSTARPRFPVVIVACNKEVLADAHPDDGSAARGLKRIDLDTLTVSWRDEVFAFYQKHPEQFRRDHPHLKLGATPRIGHAVTYFVDPSMYQLLQQIPADERQADLRLMTDAADVALAILASTSEPTYFDPVVEQQPAKLVTWGAPGDLGNVQQRTYYGGYIVSVPAQDVRRMLPGVRVLGTGWRHNPMIARKLLANWLLADVEAVAQRAEWWIDLEANPNEEFQSHMGVRDLSSQQEFDFGQRRAAECFAGQAGLPVYAYPPRWATPAEHAIWPTQAVDAMLVKDGQGAERLNTMRGIGTLLSPDAKP